MKHFICTPLLTIRIQRASLLQCGFTVNNVLYYTLYSKRMSYMCIHVLLNRCNTKFILHTYIITTVPCILKQRSYQLISIHSQINEIPYSVITSQFCLRLIQHNILIRKNVLSDLIIGINSTLTETNLARILIHEFYKIHFSIIFPYSVNLQSVSYFQISDQKCCVHFSSLSHVTSVLSFHSS